MGSSWSAKKRTQAPEVLETLTLWGFRGKQGEQIKTNSNDSPKNAPKVLHFVKRMNPSLELLEAISGF
jgi:hypothetical protein